jgi:hypothetical protein
MKKILLTFGVIGLLIVAACETPQPTTDPNTGDSTVNNNTQTDTSTNKPDTTHNP